MAWNDQFSLNEWWVEDFESLVYHLGQQEGSRLRGTVRNRTGSGNIYNFERLAKKDMSSKSDRNQTLAASSGTAIGHSRRKATVQTWNWWESVDNADVVRILTDPESEYLISAAAAMGRKIDDIIVDAVVSNTSTTANPNPPTGSGGPGVAAALPAGQVITGTKMTLDLLRQAKRKLDEAEVGVMQGGYRTCVINAKALQDLLEVTEVTSADYNTVKALVQGELNTFLGFNFVRTELIPGESADNVSAGKKGVLCYERSAVGLAISDDRFTRVAEDPSIGFSTRVYCELTMGAARIEDEGIVVINIDAT